MCHHLPGRGDMPTTVPYSLLANVIWAPAQEGLGRQEEQPVHRSAAGDRDVHSGLDDTPGGVSMLKIGTLRIPF